MVKEAGLSKAFNMDLADVLVTAEEAYHIMHSIYREDMYQHECQQAHAAGYLGISYYEPGRYRRTKSAGDLLSILADTAAAYSYVPERLVDALLARVATSWLAWE